MDVDVCQISECVLLDYQVPLELSNVGTVPHNMV